MAHCGVVCRFIWIFRLWFTLKHLHVDHYRESSGLDRDFNLLPPCDPLWGLESLLLLLDPECLPGFQCYFFDSHVRLVKQVDLRVCELRPIGNNHTSILLLAKWIKNALG